MMETVADILGDAAYAPKAAPPLIPAMLPDAPPLPAPGIYFGMPEDIYHALPALGSHDIQRLAASPMLFWAGCTWLSEGARKREAERKAKPDEREHRTVGRAYHCRLLEGADEYAKRYAVHLSAEDCEGALESTDQIKAAIASFPSEKPWSKVPDHMPDGKGGMQMFERAAKKDDWIKQLEMLDRLGRFKILARLKEQHAQANAGKEFVSFEAHEQILTAARMIEADENCRHALVGGYPEVTLIWHCSETGVPCKARVDRLKLAAAVDLKSIANRGERSIDSAIIGALHSYKYTVQPSHYLDGMQTVKQVIRSGNGTHLGPIVSYGDLAAKHGLALRWAAKWAEEAEEPEWWWLFQAKGYAPITRLVRYRKELSTRIATDEIRRQALRTFAACADKFKLDPWLDTRPPYDITDDDFRDSIVAF